MIPYGRQNIEKCDIDAVIDVLNSDFLTQGPVVPSFENQVSELTQAAYCYGVNSATSALHVACLALRVGVGDKVWTTANSFVASANCALYCGADIDFVDIEPLSLNMSIDALSEKLEVSERLGILPKVVIAVHFAGASVDMYALNELSKIYGFSIIEDASHAIGARYDNNQIGSCKYSDIAVFSFHPVKIITTGEGGMLMTNNETLGSRINLFRSHGITKASSEFKLDKVGGWLYEQHELGFNYRMTDIQAALGISQLERLDKFLGHRKLIANRYERLLESFPILQQQRDIENSSNHLFVVQLKKAECRLDIFNHMRKNGVGVNVHYIPIYHQPFYLKKGFKKSNFPNTEDYYSRCLSLPIFYNMTLEEQDHVINTLILGIKELNN